MLREYEGVGGERKRAHMDRTVLAFCGSLNRLLGTRLETIGYVYR